MSRGTGWFKMTWVAFPFLGCPVKSCCCAWNVNGYRWLVPWLLIVKGCKGYNKRGQLRRGPGYYSWSQVIKGCIERSLTVLTSRKIPNISASLVTTTFARFACARTVDITGFGFVTTSPGSGTRFRTLTCRMWLICQKRSLAMDGHFALAL